MLLAVAPWTAWWDRNRFAELAPALEFWMHNAYVRGAVTGIGIVTTLAGLGDLIGLLFARFGRAVETDPPAR